MAHTRRGGRRGSGPTGRGAGRGRIEIFGVGTRHQDSGLGGQHELPRRDGPVRSGPLLAPARGSLNAGCRQSRSARAQRGGTCPPPHGCAPGWGRLGDPRAAAAGEGVRSIGAEQRPVYAPGAERRRRDKKGEGKEGAPTALQCSAASRAEPAARSAPPLLQCRCERRARRPGRTGPRSPSAAGPPPFCPAPRLGPPLLSRPRFVFLPLLSSLRDVSSSGGTPAAAVPTSLRSPCARRGGGSSEPTGRSAVGTDRTEPPSFSPWLPPTPRPPRSARYRGWGRAPGSSLTRSGVSSRGHPSHFHLLYTRGTSSRPRSPLPATPLPPPPPPQTALPLSRLSLPFLGPTAGFDAGTCSARERAAPHPELRTQRSRNARPPGRMDQCDKVRGAAAQPHGDGTDHGRAPDPGGARRAFSGQRSRCGPPPFPWL